MDTPTIAQPTGPPRRAVTVGAVPDGAGRLHSLRDALVRALDLVDAALAAADTSACPDASRAPVPTAAEYIAAIRGGDR